MPISPSPYATSDNGVLAVKVRPFSPDDALAILAEDIPAGLFFQDRTGRLMPVEFESSDRPHDVHPMVVDASRSRQPVADTSVVLGLEFTANFTSAYGQSPLLRFATTSEAAQAVRANGHQVNGLWVADDEGSVDLQVIPAYGSTVTASFIVAGIEPEEIKRRAQSALEAEFGEDLIWVKLLSRFVTDNRVHVFDMDGNLIAANVLEAETMRYRHPLSTSPVAPSFEG